MTTAPARPALGLFVGRETPRLYDHVLAVLGTRHYSPRTADTYVHWVKRFIAFHGGRHPRELSEEDVNAFLTDLALRGRVAAATQNQGPCRHPFLVQARAGETVGAR